MSQKVKSPNEQQQRRNRTWMSVLPHFDTVKKTQGCVPVFHYNPSHLKKSPRWNFHGRIFRDGFTANLGLLQLSQQVKEF